MPPSGAGKSAGRKRSGPDCARGSRNGRRSAVRARTIQNTTRNAPNIPIYDSRRSPIARTSLDKRLARFGMAAAVVVTSVMISYSRETDAEVQDQLMQRETARER